MVNWRRVIKYEENNLKVKFGIVIDKGYTREFTEYTEDIANELIKQYPYTQKEKIKHRLIQIHMQLKEKYQSEFDATFIYKVEKDRESVRKITKEFMKRIKRVINELETENKKLETWIYTVADLDVKNNKVIPIVKPVKSTEGENETGNNQENKN